MLIDTHAHIYLDAFDADREAVMSRAFERLSHVLMPNIDLKSLPALYRTAEEHPGRCLQMMGLHPCSVDADVLQVLAKIETELAKGGFVAIGETGLDYYWDTTHKEKQQDSLRTQLRWARELKLPVVLHTRDSFDDTLRLVQEEQDGNLRGVFHCFGGSVEEARAVVDVGFHMGIGGVLTYKKNTLIDTLREVGLSRVMLETDCPYLPPVPHRGKRNEPAFVLHVAEFLADGLGLTFEAVAEQTSQTARQLFALGAA